MGTPQANIISLPPSEDDTARLPSIPADVTFNELDKGGILEPIPHIDQIKRVPLTPVTDLSTIGVKRGRVRKGGEGKVQEGEGKLVPVTVSAGRNDAADADDHALDHALELCLAAVRNFDRGSVDNNGQLARALVRVMQLHEQSRARPEAFERLLATRGIRRTKATTNPFTPVVKLAFNKSENPSTTVSRYAAALRYAAGCEVTSKNLEAFLRKKGVNDCAKFDRLDNPRQPSLKEEEQFKVRLDASRQANVVVKHPALRKNLEAEVVALLGERLADGSYRILGYRDEGISGIKRYKPID